MYTDNIFFRQFTNNVKETSNILRRNKRKRKNKAREVDRNRKRHNNITIKNKEKETYKKNNKKLQNYLIKLYGKISRLML